MLASSMSPTWDTIAPPLNASSFWVSGYFVSLTSTTVSATRLAQSSLRSATDVAARGTPLYLAEV